MNKIFIEDFVLVSKHGYYKQEHLKEQRFVVSVYCDIKTEMVNDDLNETFNYEIIRGVIQEVIMGKHKKLLETLVEEIGEKILKYKIVEQVEVKITKPDVWGDCSPGVHIIRTK